MAKPFPLTEASVRKLSPPASGRVYAKDSRFPGLQLCLTSAGARTYYYVRRIDGKPTRVRLGTIEQLSVEAARKAAAEMAGNVATGRDPQAERRRKRQEPTLQMLFDHWMLYARAHKKPKSYLEDERQYGVFLKAWGDRRLSSITKANVQELHSRIGRDNGIYAANRLLSLFKAMMNKSSDIGHRGDNPANGIKAFREQTRDRFLKPGELHAFFQALEAEKPLFRDFFLVSLLTGARKTNTLMMQWVDLDLVAGYWRIGDTKGGNVVVVPLVAPVLAILKARHDAANGSPWVFPGHRHGDYLKEPKTAWKRICERAGLSDLRPHDLRRSLGSWMASTGASLPTIGRQLGHTQAQTTMIYSRLCLDPLREAVDKATSAMLTAGGVKLLGVEEEGGDHREE